MGLLSEYINKGWDAKQLEEELKNLITRYNIKRSTFLLVFVSAMGKAIPDIALSQEDYYIIADILKAKTSLYISSSDLFCDTKSSINPKAAIP